jgi:hypothetical protein
MACTPLCNPAKFVTMRRASLLLLLLCHIGLSGQISTPLGQWQDYPSYTNLNSVSSTSSGIVASSETAIFYYDVSDGSVQTFTKVDGLSSSNISVLEYDSESESTYIGYADGNIDVLDAQGHVANIGDLVRSTLIGDKSINGFKKIGSDIWVLTALGILVVDPNTNFIKDTYRFGDNGASIDVKDIELINDTIWAATAIGLYKAGVNDNFLANFQNWKKQDIAAAPSQVFNAIEYFNGKMYLNYNSGSWPNDVMLESSDLGNSFVVSPIISGYQCKGLKATEEFMLISDLYATSVFNTNFDRIAFSADFEASNILINDAVYKNGTLFQATTRNAVIRSESGNQEMIQPNGPQSNSIWQVEYNNGILAIAGGGVGSTHSNNFSREGFSYLNASGQWNNNPFEGSELGGFADALSITIDPRDASHYFVGTYGYGLLEFQENALIKVHDYSNSSLEDRPESPGATYPNHVEFDASGNLWVINSFASKPVKIFTTESNWLEFEVDPATGNRNLFTFSNFDVTSNNQVWIAKNRDGITVVDVGDLSTIADDQTRYLTTTFGQGGLPSADVKCIAEDNDGAIWCGSDKGIFVYYSPLSIFTNGELNAQQILIEQDGNVQIVLETEQVNDIYIDGGNRKWIATEGSGLYLLSANGEDQIAHYTFENSSLISNTVLSLSMNNLSGELFIGTDKGLQSVQTDAKRPEFGDDIALRIFPNPIRKDYTDPVVIEGFASSTEFTVTNATGQLVFRGETNGGRATWNYIDLKGNAVQSGVYFVFAQDDLGLETRKGKFLLFR